jgi:uncharacterized protein (DUF433 family)
MAVTLHSASFAWYDVESSGGAIKTERSQSRPAFHDSRYDAAYAVSEAAHYLQIPEATLRSWTVGRHYPVRKGDRFFEPVIVVASRHPLMLSFVNLVEAHVLDAIRSEYKVALPAVRNAIGFLRRELDSKHPLAEQKFETDGKDLFIRKLGALIAVSRDGQGAMPDILEAYLKRIDWDVQGLAARLYPFTRQRDLTQPKVIMIDPRISFGRPVLAGTGIRTELIAERYKAGDSMDQLARDYGRDRAEIEEAVRCELAIKAA